MKKIFLSAIFGISSIFANDLDIATDFTQNLSKVCVGNIDKIEALSPKIVLSPKRNTIIHLEGFCLAEDNNFKGMLGTPYFLTPKYNSDDGALILKGKNSETTVLINGFSEYFDKYGNLDSKKTQKMFKYVESLFSITQAFKLNELEAPHFGSASPKDSILEGFQDTLSVGMIISSNKKLREDIETQIKQFETFKDFTFSQNNDNLIFDAEQNEFLETVELSEEKSIYAKNTQDLAKETKGIFNKLKNKLSDIEKKIKTGEFNSTTYQNFLKRYIQTSDPLYAALEKQGLIF
ncbi:MAG TPA: hypothetical protein VI959_00020 [Alphaproteobacteria bacterium]|nr:hypothetical protein [Alphaproteobacteria bacterium]